MNIKLVIEYDGTDFSGWQVQAKGRTIQDVLEKSLEQILGKKVRLRGSGRTDAGVHASGQVANFSYDGELDLWRLQRGLNAVTPADLCVRKIETASDHFDARRDARSRVYQYRIWNSPWPSVFQQRFAWHVYEPLNLRSMEEAIRALEGDLDLSSFQAAGCDATHPVRRIHHNSLRQEGELILYTIEANAFLRHMVRNIVGTMVEVGRGIRSAGDISALLNLRDRKRAGPTAPAQGLFLLEVKY